MSNSIRTAIAISILFVCSSLLLSGCWDRKEINRLGIVLMSAIDADEDGGIIGTVQIPLPAGGGAENGKRAGGNGDKSFYTISAKGKNINDMIQHLQERSSRELFVSHRRVLLIGESLAERGLKDVLDYYTRAPDSRLRTYVFIVRGRMAGELLDISIPSEQVPGTAIMELAKSKVATGSKLSNIVNDMSTDGIFPVIDVLEVKPASILEETKGNAGWTFRLSGSAVIKDYKLIGFLDIEKMRGLLWMRDMMSKGVVTTQISEKEGEVSFEVVNSSRKMRFIFHGDEVKVNISLKVEGPVYENNTNLDLSEPSHIKKVEEALGSAIKTRVEQTIETAQQELRSDIFGIGKELYQTHPTKWKEIKGMWEDIFPEIEIAVNVEVKVRRSGIIGAPLHLKEDELDN